MSEPAPTVRPAYAFGEFSLDLERGCLWRGREPVKLRPQVFEALRYLVLNRDRLVAKEELIRALWPDSFVTDDSLVQCVVELRRALGGEAHDYIRTVPRRGYVFTAAVSERPPLAPAAEPVAASAPRERARRTATALAALAIAAAAVSTFVVPPRPPLGTNAFTDRDAVLVAELDNATGDAVFDGTLRRALAVHLGQSPFLDVVSEERTREALRYMGRSPDARLTRALAREVAQRQGVKAVLAGSIARLGRLYVIQLEAVNAATGASILRAQVEAESRERILERLGAAASGFREKLGESVASIERFAAPLEQATTPSLEAFKAYDLGRERQFSGRYFEAVPFYRRALELDPEFALAYAALGITYGLAREDELAAQASARAFALKERVTERERFYIAARYHMDVRGDTDRAVEVLELWKETYPRDFVPRTNLSARYGAVGEHERALAEAHEGVRLNPEAGVAYAALAHSAICLGRGQEARAALERARARRLDPPYGRYMLYGLAFLDGDPAGMQEQVDAVAGTPLEAGMRAMQSVAAASLGQVRRARELTHQAVELAESRALREGAGLYSAGAALWEAAYGNCAAAKRAATRALARSRPRNALPRSALALALCGEAAAAERLVAEMERRFPADTFLETLWAPMTQAALEVRRDRPARAIERLRPAARAERGTEAALWPAYLRGLAYLELGAAAEARVEFQKVVDHKGVLAPKDFSPAAMTLYPLAYLGLARAGSGPGDERRQACEALLALWAGADPDLPALATARRVCGGTPVPPRRRAHRAAPA